MGQTRLWTQPLHKKSHLHDVTVVSGTSLFNHSYQPLASLTQEKPSKATKIFPGFLFHREVLELGRSDFCALNAHL